MKHLKPRNNFKNERRKTLNNLNFRKITARSTAAAFVVAAIFTVIPIMAGCSDNVISGSGNHSTDADHQITSRKDSTRIQLDLNLNFKSGSISTSKFLESNQGNRFNNIIKIDRDIKPGETLDLENLQPTGIFGLYLSSDGTFSMENSSGLSFRSKTVLMEKCEFIDLKIINNEQYIIKVTGFVAGE